MAVDAKDRFVFKAENFREVNADAKALASVNVKFSDTGSHVWVDGDTYINIDKPYHIIVSKQCLADMGLGETATDKDILSKLAESKVSVAAALRVKNERTASVETLWINTLSKEIVVNGESYRSAGRFNKAYLDKKFPANASVADVLVFMKSYIEIAKGISCLRESIYTSDDAKKSIIGFNPKNEFTPEDLEKLYQSNLAELKE